MSSTRPEEAHHVKKGCTIMLKGHPCKVVDVKTSKTGKHGHAKCNITGIDLFDGKKYNEVHPGHIILAAFDSIKSEYDLVNIEDDNADVIDADGNQHNFKIDQDWEFRTQMIELFAEGKYIKVTVLTAPVGEKEPPLVQKIIEFKVEKEEA
jgi:translation initiation factor 5A